MADPGQRAISEIRILGCTKAPAAPKCCTPQEPPALLAPKEPNPVTIAHNSHVLVVVAVVDAPAVAPALAQGCLPALAVHVVQEDGPTPLAEGHGSWQGDGMATAQLATHHVGIHDVPVVVADRPPGAVVEDLHSALAPAGPVGETDLWEEGNREVQYRDRVTQGHRDRVTQGHRDTGTQSQRHSGTQEHRDMGTQGHRDAGTR